MLARRLTPRTSTWIFPQSFGGPASPRYISFNVRLSRWRKNFTGAANCDQIANALIHTLRNHRLKTSVGQTLYTARSGWLLGGRRIYPGGHIGQAG
jgi:mRNA-degrading endonuclease toxin of MazEF toxin-antitoxin module